MKSLIADVIGLAGFGLLTSGFYLQFGLAPALMFSGGLLLVGALAVVSRIDIDIQRTGINELGNKIVLWRRDGPVTISFNDLWSVITNG